MFGQEDIYSLPKCSFVPGTKLICSVICNYYLWPYWLLKCNVHVASGPGDEVRLLKLTMKGNSCTGVLISP